MRPRAEELQTTLAQGRLDRAVAILQRLDPTVATDTFTSMPHEDQQVLFRRLPTEFAARLAPIFPYYTRLSCSIGQAFSFQVPVLIADK